MTKPDFIDWDDAFDNSGYITGADDYIKGWQNAALSFRQHHANAELNISYADHPRCVYDLFHSNTPCQGLVVFVHGGYWHKLNKDYWSHLASALNTRGWSVAIASYPLAPDHRIAEIGQCISDAVSAASQRISGPIRLLGHSAGGQLISRLNQENSPLSSAVQDRLAHSVALSGVFDLRPLQLTKMNDILNIDASEALSESPVLHKPKVGSSICFWVGADERPEFLRQNRLITEKWLAEGAAATAYYQPQQQHFSVVSQLSDANSPLLNELLR